MPKTVNIREAADIVFMHQRSMMLHVDDPGALDSFKEGDTIFDVHPHCLNIDRFVEMHQLDAEITSDDILPPTEDEPDLRTVWFARARYQKATEPPEPAA
jgi:hypothetical protein